MTPSDIISIETETSFDSMEKQTHGIIISNPTQTIGVIRTSEESPGMDTMDTINNNETRKTQDRDRTAGLDLQSKKDDIDSIEVIDETVESARCFKNSKLRDKILPWLVVIATIICNWIFGKYRHRELKLDGAQAQGEICNYLKSEKFSKTFLSHIGKNK